VRVTKLARAEAAEGWQEATNKEPLEHWLAVDLSELESLQIREELRQHLQLLVGVKTISRNAELDDGRHALRGQAKVIDAGPIVRWIVVTVMAVVVVAVVGDDW
jgi:hypothetical protein